MSYRSALQGGLLHPETERLCPWVELGGLVSVSGAGRVAEYLLCASPQGKSSKCLAIVLPSWDQVSYCRQTQAQTYPNSYMSIVVINYP